MKRWAIIHAASGSILMLSSRQAYPARAGMIVEEAPRAISPEAHWWNGTAFASRETATISLPVTFAEAGQILALTRPSGAWYARTDGSLANDANVTVQGGLKQNRFTLAGRYLGETTIDVMASGTSAATMQDTLITNVKREAERRKMLSFSAGNGKAQEYVQKGKEAASSATLTAAVLNALSVVNAAAQYPMAHAERIITGETLAAVLARYRASKSTSDAELARLSAIEWKAVQAIKAATTAAAKQAAFSSINWNQTI